MIANANEDRARIIKFDPYNPQHINRLRNSINWSRERLRKFRVKYRQLIEQFVTDNYTEENSSQKEVVVNLLGMAVEIHVLHLAPSRPQVCVATDFREYASVAKDFEIALNRDFESMEMEKIFAEVCTDAWFSVGIFKLFLEEGNMMQFANEMIDIGNLKVSSVSIDRWVHDCTARKWNECEFMGDLQRKRLSDLIDSPLYQNTDQLHPTTDTAHGSYDEFGEQTAADLSIEGTNTEALDASIMEYVEVWEVFMPREQIVVTLPKEQNAGPNLPLRVVDWNGPKHGPYHMLSLSDVPENIMPASPGMQLQNLHKLVNNLYRKLNDQAKRQKEVTLVKPGQEEGGKSIRDAGDGDMIGVEDPSAIASVRFGGIDAQNHGFAVHAMGLFDQHAGNLQMLGGLSPSADTVGQEQILQAQSSARLEKQKYKIQNIACKLAKDIAWYRWRDVFYNPRVVKKVPGTEVQVLGSFAPHDRLGEFVQYNFDIEPHSLQYMPPAAKLNSIKGILGEVIMPLAPMMMEQGIAIDVEALMKLLARYGNVPELLEILTFANGEQHENPEGKSMDSVMKSPVTRRENVRINKSGNNSPYSDQAIERNMARSAMGEAGGNVNVSAGGM